MTPARVEDVIEEIATALREYGTAWGLAAVRLTLIRPDGGRRFVDYPEKEDQ